MRTRMRTLAWFSRATVLHMTHADSRPKLPFCSGSDTTHVLSGASSRKGESQSMMVAGMWPAIVSNNVV